MDLDYFVTLPSGEERQLLQKVTAHVEPGRMVALVVTVMDAIAVRMTGGRIVGDICVNGELKDLVVSRHSTRHWCSLITSELYGGGAYELGA
ncbi:hypothetical protein PI126_g21287 [Phytophthora idaei]|nr:hypothetical protein PI126_g21287 [Phytophthora idaei]